MTSQWKRYRGAVGWWEYGWVGGLGVLVVSGRTKIVSVKSTYACTLRVDLSNPLSATRQVKVEGFCLNISYLA